MTNIKNNTNPGVSSRPDSTTMQMNTQTRNITVEVSGSRFCIVPSLFKHIENLPWKKRKNKSLKLNANPDVFESVLQFFLSKKLPDPTTLSSRRARTLIEFVEPLDPVAVKPLVSYLQTFVSEKSSTDNKNSFMRRSLNTISSPFATKAPKSKTSKPSKSSKINVGQTANQNANGNSGNKCQPKNSDMPPTIPTELGTTATPAITSTIPKHIQHPTTESTHIAEISVCSMDDSSVSKLSLQSSPSYHVTTQQTGRPNEFSMAVSVSSSAASTHQKADHRKNPFDQFIQYYPHQSARIEGGNDVLHQRRCTQQDPGVSADMYVQKENPFSTPMRFGSEYPRAVESRQPTSSGFSKEQFRQSQPQAIAQVYTNSTVPFAHTQNVTTSVNRYIGENNGGAINNTLSGYNNPRGTTKIFRTVLGGNGKKSGGTTSSNGSRILFRKQEKMTHAEWCASASEYIV